MKAVRLIVLAALVLASTAEAANEFTLTTVSQTSSTITFSYPQQPGYGYLYSANGAVVSRTNSPTRTQVTFSKNSAGSYEVAAIVKGTSGTYQPAPPKPACSDGIDNDGDGKVDLADPGCTGATDSDETDPVQPPPPTGTISPAQFTALATAGATVANVTVTGSVDLTRANVTINNVFFQGVIRFRAGATGAHMVGGGGLGFDILSADNVTIENGAWNGQHRRDQNFIWDDPAGDIPNNITLRGNTFQGYCCAGAHEEALYVGTSNTGLIEGNSFTDNATQNGTAHIFFTYCGQKSGNYNGCQTNALATEAKNWCVQGNTFGPGPRYYSIQVHEFVPASANIRINPNQQTVKPLIGPTQTQANLFGKPC